MHRVKRQTKTFDVTIDRMRLFPNNYKEVNKFESFMTFSIY